MNIITFDIEEWFHIQMDPKFNVEKKWNTYESRLDKNMNLIFELLERHNQKATFFCLGWVARKHPEILKKIVDYGHELASHSDMHRIAYTLSEREYILDFERAISSIQEVTGKKVSIYRAPAFSIKEENKWTLEVLLENGIEIDSSIFPMKRDFGGFENFNSAEPCIIQYGDKELKEFPINLFSILGQKFVFSGGGYFRLSPLWATKRMMNKSEYVMTYFHPRDFDPDIPKIEELSRMRKFKSYVGLATTYNKLDYLLEHNDFLSIGEASNIIDWNTVKKIQLK